MSRSCAEDPSGADAPAGERGRFILSGSPEVLGPLGAALDRDPTATVVARSPAGPRPERLVVETTPARAADLGLALAGAVLVEPDEFVAPPTPSPP